MIRVLVVSDSEPLREAVAEAIGTRPDIAVVGVYREHGHGAAAIAESRPAVVVMNELSREPTAPVMAEYRRVSPETKIVLLRVGAPSDCEAAADAVADPDDGLPGLVDAIRRVAR